MTHEKTSQNLLQQNSLLSETDLDSDEDPIFKRIPNTPKLQTTEFYQPY